MPVLDFRVLSYFLVACEHESLGAAARELGIAPSTLSASLKSLETGFGVSLFRKQGAGLAPRRLAQWLYRAAMPLLLLEAFARRRIAVSDDAPATRLKVDVRLHFGFGQFCGALGRAIAHTAEAEPMVLVDPGWALELGAAFGTVSLDGLDFAADHVLEIDSVARPADLASGEIALCDDPWMLVRRRFGPLAPAVALPVGAPLSVLIPAFSLPVIEQIVGHCRAHGIEIQPNETAPGDWPQILEDNPGVAVLLPASGITARRGMARADVIPLDPPLATTLIARTDDSPLALRFVDRLKSALQRGDAAPAFAPVLTERRVRYFNLAFDLGRISAAARAAGVAQPALSQQIHKLEASLGTLLFDRKAYGLIRTGKSVALAMATRLLDRRLREMQVSGMTASLGEGGRLSLGVLPSVSHHGHLVNRITDAVLALRDAYPAMSVTVREAPDGTLQNWVMRGRVGLAIVETTLAQMPRMSLDASEELAVIVDPRHNLLPPGPVKLADLVRVPLVLPTTLFGIRRLLDKAAREAGIELRPRHEIDAVTMLIALLLREPIATVLPASAVRSEIVSREFACHPIIEPTINRKLFVIYSGDRSLTPAERDLVRLLRESLSKVAQERFAPLTLLG